MRSSFRCLPLLVPFVALALGSARPSVSSGADPLARPPVPETVVVAAADALAQGRPWRATRLLERAVRDPRSRTPEIVALAASAAGAWEGWRHVEDLLSAESWLDTLFDGRGRALLARAAFERGADTLALSHARRAIYTTADDAEQGARLVLLARAFDRLEQCDSARIAYTRAGSRLPEIQDWLRLRAAAVTPDSAARERQYATLGTEVARARVRWVDAEARERAGDLAGAARAYEALGAPATALRLRLAMAPDTAELASIRGQLFALIERWAGSTDVRTAVDLIDRTFAPLTAGEELAVARRAGASGAAARAAIGYARAFEAGYGTARDRFAYGTILSQLGREREAAAQFGLIKAPPLAASAAYQRARSLLRSGQGAEARSALRAVAATHARDTAAAAAALFLLADLASDDRQDAAARRTLLKVAHRYPTSVHAPRARFRAAMIAFIASDSRAAALELDTLLRRYPNGEDANAALYWSGRAWERTGDSVTAQARWSDIITRDPLSYYAMLSTKRLGKTPWTPPPDRDVFQTHTAVDSALARAALLERLGMKAEARLEYDRLVADADQSPDRLMATAAAFRDRGLASYGIQLGRRALARGAPRDARVYRLVYPLSDKHLLVAEAEAHGLDQALIAALIRQESSFDPRATSRAGAAGLMQVMPAVGRQLAGTLGFGIWNAALLYQPDVNVQLGSAHLAALVRGQPDLAYAIAAYNAGGSRVERWSAKLGADDPEVFIERIPFTETRDYVRIVLRNRELYRALYQW